MASGALPSPPGMKFFFYALKGNDYNPDENVLFLFQMIIINSTGDVTLNIKSSTNDLKIIHSFIDVLKNGLNEYSPSYVNA